MANHVYFIADLHFDQANITQHRPQFQSIRDHDRYIVDQINKTVNPNDTLYLPGDVAIRAGANVSLAKIRCRNIVLIPGNHCGERSAIDFSHYSKVMGAAGRRFPRQSLGAVITHIPVHPQCLDRWDINIHGHLHSETIDDPRYFCVSCEVINYTPISMEEIYYRLAARQWPAEWTRYADAFDDWSSPTNP